MLHVLFFCSIIHVTLLYMKNSHKEYRKAIKAVSGFPGHFQYSKVTESATKRCVRASGVCVCAHAGAWTCVCLFTAGTAKLLRPKEELLKQLLTSVSSADHHLVPAPGLPSYGIAVHPHLTEGSKRCSVCPASPTTTTTSEENTSATTTQVLCNNFPAK